MAPDYEYLIVKKEKGVCTLTFNRPKAYNALNYAMIMELESVLGSMEADDEMQVLIVTGGEKFFSSGGDIKYMLDASPLDIYHLTQGTNKVMDRLENLPFPTIAAINGPCLGGGCELALCCDFRIAGESALFGLPELSVGIMPGSGGTQRLQRFIGVENTKRMIFLAENISAARALELGLTSMVVPDDQVMDEALKTAGRLMAKPGFALRLTKEAINWSMNGEAETGKAYERQGFALVFTTEDQKEGMRAFIEKRKPVFRNR